MSEIRYNEGSSCPQKSGVEVDSSLVLARPCTTVMLARPPEAVAACRPFSVRWDIPQRYEDGSSSASINCLIAVVPVRPLVITGGTVALAGRL